MFYFYAGVKRRARSAEFIPSYCQNRVAAGWAGLLGAELEPERRLALAEKAALGGGSAGNDQLAVAGSAAGCGATNAGLEYVGVEGAGQAKAGTPVELPESGVREDDWPAGPAGISDRGAALAAGWERVLVTAESNWSLTV